MRVVSPEGRLRYEAWPERDLVLGMTDILKTDAIEAEFLTGTADIREATRILAALGPREIVLTHKDGLLVLADGRYYEAPFQPVGTARPQRSRRYLRRFLCLAAPRRRSRRIARAGRRPLTSLKLEAEGADPAQPRRRRAAC